MMSLFTLCVGLLSQACFSARILVQWVLSERSHRLVSPTLYWVLSLVGSGLMFYYGSLRQDFSIIVGQFLSFYIYIANLHYKGIWASVPKIVHWLLYAVPLIAVWITASDIPSFTARFLRNSEVPLWLLLVGTVGQVVFSCRFIWQIAYSIRHHASLLPVSFWVISLVGSAIILAYALIRLDWVLMLGQAFGLVAYVRNVFIGRQAEKTSTSEE